MSNVEARIDKLEGAAVRVLRELVDARNTGVALRVTVDKLLRFVL